MLSLVVPVYKNEESIAELVAALEGLDEALGGELEAVLVVDGSPDRSLERLRAALPGAAFRSQLVVLSRNFGAFPAILAGLAAARGARFAVMAADLQEPTELVLRFDELLRADACDLAVGVRGRRADPLASRLASALFWRAYRAFVQREIPVKGVDVFACNRQVRDHLLALRERHTSLVGLLFWLGFRRAELPYDRRPRHAGRSAWSFRRRLRYLLDSTFSFTDLPLRLLTFTGLAGMALAVGLAIVVLAAKWRGEIPVPGYAATALLVIFFGGMNSLGLGIVGEYVWRAYENSKERPSYVVATSHQFPEEPVDRGC
jgi:glycosyltransferase involved in cell wall biosynthesis